MSQIRIVVIGGSKTGKSVITTIIQMALTVAGLKVEVTDERTRKEKTINQVGLAMSGLRERGVTVHIETVQTPQG